ncbi:hypothetical protein WYO_0160 [Methylobacterium sp. GXF4]|nr:hypothetical protein WYO_0160 [Methylobacterium sp. GXF4]
MGGMPPVPKPSYGSEDMVNVYLNFRTLQYGCPDCGAAPGVYCKGTQDFLKLSLSHDARHAKRILAEGS